MPEIAVDPNRDDELRECDCALPQFFYVVVMNHISFGPETPHTDTVATAQHRVKYIM
jgi:hypothetical protein